MFGDSDGCCHDTISQCCSVVGSVVVEDISGCSGCDLCFECAVLDAIIECAMFDDISIRDICITECDRLVSATGAVVSIVFFFRKGDIILHDSDKLFMVFEGSCAIIFGDDLHGSSCVVWETISTGKFSVSCSYQERERDIMDECEHIEIIDIRIACCREGFGRGECRFVTPDKRTIACIACFCFGRFLAHQITIKMIIQTL